MDTDHPFVSVLEDTITRKARCSPNTHLSWKILAMTQTYHIQIKFSQIQRFKLSICFNLPAFSLLALCVSVLIIFCTWDGYWIFLWLILFDGKLNIPVSYQLEIPQLCTCLSSDILFSEPTINWCSKMHMSSIEMVKLSLTVGLLRLNCSLAVCIGFILLTNKTWYVLMYPLIFLRFFFRWRLASTQWRWHIITHQRSIFIHFFEICIQWIASKLDDWLCLRWMHYQIARNWKQLHFK